MTRIARHPVLAGFLSLTLLLSGPIPIIHAADPVLPFPAGGETPQPEVGTEGTLYPAADGLPEEGMLASLMQMNESVLSSAEAVILTENPKLDIQGSNFEDAGKLPGMGRIVSAPDDDTVAYRFDVGTAHGAVLDAVIEKEGVSWDLAGGLEFDLARLPGEAGHSTIQQLHLLLEDVEGKKISEILELNQDNSFKSFMIDFSGKDIDAGKISKLVFRHYYYDLREGMRHEERVGEIHLRLGGVNANPVVPGEAYDTEALSVFDPEAMLLAYEAQTSRPFAIAPFIVPQPDNGNQRSFRYDVGTSQGARVAAVITPKVEDFISRDQDEPFVIAVKNTGADVQASLTIYDGQGRKAEYSLDVTDQMQNFVIDYRDLRFAEAAGGINAGQMERIEIGVTRKAGAGRRGELTFELQAPDVVDPFGSITPAAPQVTPSLSGDTELQFAEIDGAVIYQVQIARDLQFTDLLHEGFPIFAPENHSIQENGIFHARYRASKSTQIETGPVTNWSSSTSFEVRNFSILVPVIDSVVPGNNRDAEVVVQALAGAARYHVQVATDDQFVNLVHEGYPARTEAFPAVTSEPVQMDQDGTYFVRVRASTEDVFEQGVISQWSASVSFDVSASPYVDLKPVIEVLNADAAGQVTLDFSDLAGSALYHIQVARDDAFTDIVREGFPTESSEAFTLAENGTYYVRVRGSQNVQIETGPVSRWSDVSQVTIALDDFVNLQPVIESLSGSSSGNVDLDFGDLAGAVIYHVQVARDDAFTDIVREGFPTESSEAFSLAENGTYYVRVRGSKNAQIETGPVSQWSDVSQVTITLDDFVNLQPVIESLTGSSSGNVDLDFNDLAGAVIYHVQVARDDAFTDIVREGFPTESSEAFSLAENGTYYVRVRGSKNTQIETGPVSQWSDVSQVTITLDDFLNVKPAVPVLDVLADGSVQVVYDTIAGAVIYQVQVARDADFADIIHQGYPVTPPEIFSVAEAGTFYVRLRASKDMQLETGPVSQWSDAATFSGDIFANLKPLWEELEVQEDGTLRMDFSAVAGAASYRVEVATDDTFNDVILERETTATLLEQNLFQNGTFYVRVRASDDSIYDFGNKSLFSEVRMVTRQTGNGFLPPDAQLSSADIIGLPQGTAGAPTHTSVGPKGDAVDASKGTDRGVIVTYDTGTQGWSGGGYAFDNYSTTDIETADLSSLTHLVLGIRGDASMVKMEVIDRFGTSAAVQVGGISASDEQVWKIETSKFTGVDLTQVRLIYFIVEGPSQSGQLHINRVAVREPAAGLAPWDLAGFPDGQAGALGITTVGPGGDATNEVTATTRGEIFEYNTGTQGWAGGGFSYDDFTTTTKEYGDISQLTELQFSIKGDAPEVKFEIIDVFDKRTQVRFTGIDPNQEKVFTIPVSLLQHIDLSKVQLMFFVVEGNGFAGALELNHVPALPEIEPSAALGPSDLIDFSHDGIHLALTSLAPDGDASATIDVSPRGGLLTYNTGTQGWAGGGISFDDYSTEGTIESADLTARSELLVGLKGYAGRVKLEVHDAAGSRVEVSLVSISPTEEKVWAVPTSLLTGVDLSRIRFFFLIVEGNGESGTLEMNTLPL